MKLPLFKKRFFVTLFVLIALVSLNVFSSEVRGFFYSVSAPFHSLFWQVGGGISNFYAGILHGPALKTENETLKQDRLSLLQRIVELQAVEKENIELRNALNLGLEKDFELIFAKVIGKNIGEDTIVIAAGTEAGIAKGMAVVSAGKVVLGRVFEVSEKSSEVRLVSNKESLFDVQIQGKEVSGIVKGQGASALLLDLVPQEQEINAKDLVVTSSIGGIFPENLLVGTVAEVQKSGAEPFQKARVRPLFDIKETKSVFVVTGP